MRQMEVNDVYEGMETIGKVYGFAGLEPNSVMLGWGRNSKQPEKFAELIQNFSRLDYNIFVMDYNHDHGFGEKQTIDLWWRGGSNNVALALTLLKFLQASAEWDQAQARIFIIINDSSLNNKIYKNMTVLLEEQRVDASLKIINNAIEHKPVKDIIKIESSDSDLVLLGLPNVNSQNTASLISETDEIIHDLKTVLLIKASSFFKPIFIGIEKMAESAKSESVSGELRLNLPALELPVHDVLNARLKDINYRAEKIFIKYYEENLEPLYRSFIILNDNISRLITKSFRDCEEITAGKETHHSRKTINHIRSTFLFNLKRHIQQYKNEVIDEQKENLFNGAEMLLNELDGLKNEIPEDLTIFYDRKDIDLKTIKLSFKDRAFRRKKPVRRKVKMQSIFTYNYKVLEKKVLYDHLNDFGIAAYQLSSELQKLFNTMNDSLLASESAIIKNTFNTHFLEQQKQHIGQRLNEIQILLQNNFQKMLDALFLGLNHSMQSVAKDLDNLQSNHLLRKKLKIARKQPSIRNKILEAPDYWQKNQQLITNFFIEDLHLKSIGNRIETIVERLLADILMSIDGNYTKPLENLTGDIKQIENRKDDKLTWNPVDEEIIDTRSLFSAFLKDIQTALEELPDEIEVISEESFQKLEQDQFTEVTTVSVSLNRYIEFLTETELIEPLQKQINAMSPELQKANDVAQEVVRLVNYNLSGVADDNIATESLSSVSASAIDRLQKVIKQVEEIRDSVKQHFEKQSQAVFEKMNPVLVSRAVGELKQTIRTQEGLKYLGKVKKLSETTQAFFKNLLVRLVYQRSEGLLFAKKLGEKPEIPQSGTAQILESVRALTPDRTVEQVLPFYYRQLFLGKRMLNREFLIERPSEMEQAAKTLNIYRQGYHGAALILGERFSGKSTLSQSIAIKSFEKSKIFHLYPPEGGSALVREFKDRLSETLQSQGSFEQIFSTLQANSVLIIHDLELWWQRSPDGFAVIDALAGLINAYGSRCFFIINCNTHSYKFINRIQSLDNMFIQVMECQPFDAEEIQKAILLRHQSSGLKFQLGSVSEENISNLRKARLFNSYFDTSGGNIGYALHSWISNITKVHQQYIEIKVPQNYSAFSALNTSWQVWLQQFILHKQLTTERIEQVNRQAIHETDKMLQSFKRSGILVEAPAGVFSINPYIYPMLAKQFKETGLL